MIGIHVQINCAIWQMFVERMHTMYGNQVEIYAMKAKSNHILIRLITMHAWLTGIYPLKTFFLHIIKITIIHNNNNNLHL